MKVTLLSYDDGAAGAGRAALKLHKALLGYGVESRLRVRLKTSDLDSVANTKEIVRKSVGRFLSPLTPVVMGLQRSAQKTLRSPAWYSSGIVEELNRSDADVLQLNAINGLLSIEEIGTLAKPVVWRFSDMWPFSGGEHYGDDGPNARWRTGYTKANRLISDGGVDLDRWIWKRKVAAWKKPIHVVTPSRWLAECVRESKLMRDWPVTVIPTTLDINQFQPWPKDLARRILGLPSDDRLILFGALGGGQDPRKGRDFLEQALPRVSAEIPGVAAVIFGQSAPKNPPQLGMPQHWTGHLSDDATLALVYSAADVMILPSRQDNLPQTGVEAQSCGCPVVAFNTSGLPDVVADRESGYLARPFEVDDLAAGVAWVLGDDERRARLSRNSRERALNSWAPDVVLPQYLELYQSAIELRGRSR